VRSDIYIISVEYIDYEKDFLPEGNAMFLAMHKRKSFIHENEIRCIYYDPFVTPTEKGKLGFNAEIDLKELIQKVYISPYSPSFIEHVLSDILRKYRLSIATIRSDLYTISK